MEHQKPLIFCYQFSVWLPDFLLSRVRTHRRHFRQDSALFAIKEEKQHGERKLCIHPIRMTVNAVTLFLREGD